MTRIVTFAGASAAIAISLVALGQAQSPAPATSASATASAASPSGAAFGLTAVPGIKVGHFTLTERPTGCTVILPPAGSVGSVDVRGGAPGTRETDLLNPVNNVQVVSAVVLSGGSAYGLDSATGAMKWLEEHNIGYPVGRGVVPIVPAAILMDLGFGGDFKIRPGADCGYKAAEAATDGPIAEGNIGAGAGATVGKMGGPGRSMKGGLGTSSISLPNGLVVAALVAVNAVGDVIDPTTGQVLAGVRTEDGKSFADARKLMRSGGNARQGRPGENTTIGIVATNAKLSKVQAQKMAQMAHDGYGRAISPVHTPGDGDTIFSVATGQLEADVNYGQVGALAAEAMADAIVRAVKAAKTSAGVPGLADFTPTPASAASPAGATPRPR
jgi:L-aminopeptidase/D-esterase-like protein